ncbi:hypothetical protein KIPB_008110, partial [Kipferlia bialata]
TEGVLGERELMYDVFGDTVNTAARLMAKADDWDLLVSEDVASALSRIAERDQYIGQESLMGSAVSLEYICTRPALNFLKGKGLFPCRRVFFSEASLDQTEQCLGDILSGVLSGMVERHTTWTERMLAPAEYVQRHLGQVRSDFKGSNPDILQTLQRATSAVHINQALLDEPWAIIRARFSSRSNHGSMAQSRSQSQGKMVRVSSVPCLSQSDSETDQSGTDSSAEGVPEFQRAVDGLRIAISTPDPSSSSEPSRDMVSVSVITPELAASIYPTVLEDLEDPEPESLGEEYKRHSSSTAWLRRRRERRRRFGAKAQAFRDKPCPDIQTLDSHLLDDLQAVHENLKGGPSGNALGTLTEAVWNRERLTPKRRLILTVKSLPNVFRLSLKQTTGDTSIFLLLHTLVKISRKANLLTIIGLIQTLLSVFAAGATWILTVYPRTSQERLLADPEAARHFQTFKVALYVHVAEMVYRQWMYPLHVKRWTRTIVKMLSQTFYPKGSGEITGYRQALKDYRMCNVHRALSQIFATGFTIWPCRECKRLMDRATSLNIPLPRIGSYGMISAVLMLNETIISLYALNDIASVCVICVTLLLSVPLSIYMFGMSRESSMVFLATLMVTLFSLFVSINQVANMCVSLRQLVETVAGQTLVGRVASGRYFSRILSPVVAEASGLFDVTGALSKKDALQFVAMHKGMRTPVGVEGTVLVSMLHHQVCDMANRITAVSTTPRPDTQQFIRAYYEGLRTPVTTPSAGIQSGQSGTFGVSTEVKPPPMRVRESEIVSMFQDWYPASVSPSLSSINDNEVSGQYCTPMRCSCTSNMSTSESGRSLMVKGLSGRITPVCNMSREEFSESLHSDPIEASDSDMHSLSDVLEVSASDCSEGQAGVDMYRDTKELMRRHEISFFPLCVYVKLDIVGFTTFCESQSSNHVVATLKTLFA